MISHAVSEGMHGFLGKGKRPVGVIFIDLPPEAVDVNVHPAKEEVRFRDSQLIHQLVAQAVRQAMVDYQRTVNFSLFSTGTDDHDDGHELTAAQSSTAQEVREETPLLLSLAMGQGYSSRPRNKYDAEIVADRPSQDIVKKTSARKSDPASQPTKFLQEGELSLGSIEREEIANNDNFVAPRYLGQIGNSYLLAQASQGLLVIDQHAAHERLLYERLRRHYLEHRLASQNLLFPEMVECSPDQVDVLTKYQDDIAMFGLDIQPLGGDTWVIKAIPALLATLSPQQIFHGVMAHYLVDEGGSGARVEQLLATMACKAAVKANDQLTKEAGEALIAQMVAADIFSHCPHGRPVIRLFTLQEMGRWFKRN